MTRSNSTTDSLESANKKDSRITSGRRVLSNSRIIEAVKEHLIQMQEEEGRWKETNRRSRQENTPHLT